MLRHFFELQNRRCESFRVTSPLMISVEDDLPGLSNLKTFSCPARKLLWTTGRDFFLHPYTFINLLLFFKITTLPALSLQSSFGAVGYTVLGADMKLGMGRGGGWGSFGLYDTLRTLCTFRFLPLKNHKLGYSINSPNQILDHPLFS